MATKVAHADAAGLYIRTHADKSLRAHATERVDTDRIREILCPPRLAAVMAECALDRRAAAADVVAAECRVIDERALDMHRKLASAGVPHEIEDDSTERYIDFTLVGGGR